MTKLGLILLAAGNSTRMGTNKLALRIGGETPIERCFDAISRSSFAFSSVLVTVSELTQGDVAALCACGKYNFPIKPISGGTTRGGSVYNALRALDADTDVVVIHDAARCLVTADIIDKSIESALAFGSGIVGVMARDTIRNISGELLDRNELFITQTPQTFRFSRILSAYASAAETGLCDTDDCAVYERAGFKASFVDGGIMNQKLTCASDLPFFEAAGADARTCAVLSIRIGIGEDTHRLCVGRRLILGGVDIPFGLGASGHSDADILIHAVIDALLGAAAKGDIGTLFPDSDPAYSGISSIILLQRVRELLSANKISVNNIDATIVAQAPKLAPFIGAMRSHIAEALNIEQDRVSIKATTPEHTGAEGRLECITVRSVASIFLTL